MSIKALLDHVIEEVAVDGENGTTIPALFQYVKEFYARRGHGNIDIASICTKSSHEVNTSESNPSAKESSSDKDVFTAKALRQKVKLEELEMPNLEEEFQEYLWDLLREDKDFIVGCQNEGQNLSLKEIVTCLQKQSSHAGSSSEAVDDQSSGDHKVWKVYATEERRWRALTGHGPDPKKVPPTVYRCLEVIGKHREAGIIQPDVTKLTGQDKKSVAGRTTTLKNLGYVEKVSVLARNMNTSKLTLTKFAIRRDERRAVEAVSGSNSKKCRKTKSSGKAAEWTGATINFEELIRSVLKELKAAKNGVLMHNDLKKKMGMDKSRFHWRAFSRLLRRVEKFGVLKRILVPLKVIRSYKTNNGGEEQHVTEPCHARCVRYIKDMTNEDWKTFAVFSGRDRTPNDEEEDDGDGAVSEEDAPKAEKDAEEVDVEAVKELAKATVESVVEDSVREVPLWNRNKPVTMLMYELVNSAGRTGVSSMDLMARTMGSFYYRPMDQILHRITDFPTVSQPPQYMEFAIIRETSITGRHTHYRYFSYPFHQKLVEEGLASEPWAAKGKKGLKQGSGAGNITPVEVDEFGFPPVKSSRLLKADGTSKLADSQEQIKKKENMKTQYTSFKVSKNKDGDETVDWKNATPRHGRPRKYQPGEEPYLSARKREQSKQHAADPSAADKVSRKHSLEDNQDPNAAEGEATAPKRIGRPLKKQKIEGPPPEPKRRGRPPGRKTDPAKKAASKVSKTPAASKVVTTAEEATAAVPKNAKTPAKRGRKPKVSDDTVKAPENKPGGPKPATRSSRKRGPTTPDLAAPQQKRAKGEVVPEFQGAYRAELVDADSTTTTTTTTVGESIGAPTTTQHSKPGTNEQGINEQEATVTEISEALEDIQLLPTDPPRTYEPCGPKDRVRTLPAEIAQSVDDENQASEVQLPSEKAEIDSQGNDKTDNETPLQYKFGKVTVVLDAPDAEGGRETYGSIGGMLAMGRQQAVLELLQENGGVFPGANELRHAFNRRFQKKFPGAGNTADRRLIRGVVQALQYKGKIKQYTFTFKSTRGLFITKKLIVDAKLPLDSPLVKDMTEKMIAADGNLWFPAGTELHPDVQEKYDQNPSWSLPKSKEVEDTTFERLFPDSVTLLKQKRLEKAAERAAAKAAKAEERAKRRQIREENMAYYLAGRAAPKFTNEQREAARERKAELIGESTYENKPKEHVPGAEVRGKYKRGLDTVAPKSVWWDDFVERGTARDGTSFLKEIRDVARREMKEVQEGSSARKSPACNDFIMINHFAPEVELGDNFEQEPVVDLDDRIKAPEYDLPPRRRQARSSTVTPKHPVPLPKDEQSTGAVMQVNAQPSSDPSVKNASDVGKDVVAQAFSYLVPKRKRRRRAPGTVQAGPTRREKAMKAIHENTMRPVESPLNEVPQRKVQHRNQFTIPKEDEETLLIAIIISRTIYGGLERRIHWDFVQTAIPHQNVLTLQRRWPRVRDSHKPHLKRLQTEFEEMYLEAYSNGQLPQLDSSDMFSFDLPYHVRWFRENLEFPDAHSIPDLPLKRDVFERLYDIERDSHISSSWRSEFHNISHTMGHRANHFACHAYEVPLCDREEEKTCDGLVEYVKSVIKANIITGAVDYNPLQAFNILHAQSEENVDDAFFRLTNDKTIAHKKEKGRVTPGRNYEFTDKFHFAFRTSVGENHFAQAVAFQGVFGKAVEQDGSMKVSPLVEDGSVMAIFDMLATRRIQLERLNYRANILGLIEGYETRAMNKDLVEFDVLLKPSPSYSERLKPMALPPIPRGDLGNKNEPIRLWYDLNGALVSGMWLRVLTATLSLIINRPGINTKELWATFQPGLTMVEVGDVVQWLVERGVVDNKGTAEETLGCWPNEGYYLGLTEL